MKLRLALIGQVLVLGALLLLLTHANSANATGTAFDHLSQIQKRLVSGFLAYELNANNATNPVSQSRRLAPAPKRPFSGIGFSYFPGAGACDEHLGNNVKVNQNCLNVSDSNLQGRGQAENETAIAADPNHPDHLVAASNDYLRGDSTCGAHFSSNGGARWEDSIIPNGFTRGAAFGGVARQYWQSGGDPSVAWDSRGNTYYSCQTFMRGAGTTNNPDQSSAVYVFRSTLNGGASWNFPARPVVEFNDVAGTGCCLEDKPYMTVDNTKGSPFQDRIYVTWTEFLGDGSAYIWESNSSDFGETFSAKVLVSGNNTTLCTNTFGAGTPQGNCNENQFSDPFTGSDGNLYVVFVNFNNTPTGSDNRNQILLAKSTDGGASFSLPVKVADYYDLPDCATYQGGQNPGRACVPEKGSNMNSVFRATNYPAGGVNPTNSKQIAVTFGSYINVDSQEPKCKPDGLAADGNNKFIGVKTAGACNNKILLSVSKDGGATFTGTTTDPRALTTVNQEKGQAKTDQWWQWAAFNKNGKLAVSYYDRQYENDETTGNMDFSLSGSKDLTTFATKRATSSSMPLPTQFPNGNGNSVFFGDYTGLAVGEGAHPLWMDTRDVDLFACTLGGAPAVCIGVEPNNAVANDQDIFTVNMGIPTK
jgi:hypothetical protein